MTPQKLAAGMIPHLREKRRIVQIVKRIWITPQRFVAGMIPHLREKRRIVQVVKRIWITPRRFVAGMIPHLRGAWNVVSPQMKKMIAISIWDFLYAEAPVTTPCLSVRRCSLGKAYLLKVPTNVVLVTCGHLVEGSQEGRSQ